MKRIFSDKAPKSIGPYSQAIEFANFLFISGQIAIEPSTGEIKGDIKSQTERVLLNISEILKASGSSFSKVLKTTVFLKNMDHFTEMNEVYEKYLGETKPARSTIEVSRLPKNALVEIEVLACV